MRRLAGVGDYPTAHTCNNLFTQRYVLDFCSQVQVALIVDESDLIFYRFCLCVQYDRFRKAGRNASTIDDGNIARNIAASMDQRGRSPSVDALLLMPERLQHAQLRQALTQHALEGHICLLVVDESHLTLSWGTVRSLKWPNSCTEIGPFRINTCG